MTPQLTPSFWLEAIAVPALTVIAVFGGVGSLASRLRSGQRQRALWLAAFAAVALFLAGFGLGADRWLRFEKASPPRTEPKFIVRGNLPVGEAVVTGEPVAEFPEELLLQAEPLVTPVVATTQTLWPAWLWLGGILLVLGRAGCQRVALELSLRRRHREVSPELRARVETLAARLGMRRRVQVRVVPGLLSPAAFGCWHPMVFVPENFESGHAERERDAMLAHELAHLAARDPFWHGAARLLVTVLWWHPLAWWALGRLRSASEAAADEASVLIENGPSELAACLVALGARLQGQRIGWLGMAGNGFRSELGRRVERLLALPARDSSWRRSRIASLGTAALAVMAAGTLLAVTAWALPQHGEGRPTLLAAAQQALAPAFPTAPDGGRSSATPAPSAEDSHPEEDSWGSWNSPLQEVDPGEPSQPASEMPGPSATDPQPVQNTTQSSAVEAPAAPAQGPAANGGGSTVGGLLPPASAMDLPGADSSPASAEPVASTNLITRLYRVNPETMLRSLEEMWGSSIGTNSVSAVLRGVFEGAGVDWLGKDTFNPSGDGAGFRSPTGEALFFNVRSGDLLVRAALDDHDLFERIIALLNRTPDQVTIEAKFVEITDATDGAAGFDWLLGSTPIGGLTNAPGTDLPGVSVAPSEATPPGVFPVGSSLEASSPGQPDDGRLQFYKGDQIQWPGRDVPGATNIHVLAALEGRVMGILDDPQYRSVLRTLESRAGADVMAAPRVTTVDGRQAQIQVVELQTVVNGLKPAAFKDSENGGPPVLEDEPFRTTQVPMGPVLDVVPKVEADGRTIHLTLVATYTEFLGYDEPPAGSRVRVSINGKETLLEPALPRFRVRQATTGVRIRDGQTVVLGGMTARGTKRIKDKVPVLGDVPLVGGLFRHENEQEVRKNLLVFVTATLIDPAGNRIHPPE